MANEAGGNVGHLVQPPPGKGGERIENIITGSSVQPGGTRGGQATLSRAAALKTQRGIRAHPLPLSPPCNSIAYSLPTFEKEETTAPANRVPDLFRTVEWSPPRSEDRQLLLLCALRTGSSEYARSRPFPTWLGTLKRVQGRKEGGRKIGEELISKVARICLFLRIDDVMKVYLFRASDGDSGPFLSIIW